MVPRVKICCIANRVEAAAAIRAGASALGFVSAMPSGPGVIAESTIAEVAATVPPPIATFLLTSQTAVASIVGQQRRTGTNTIQLCDRVSPAVLRELRIALPGIRLVQVIHVDGPESVDDAIAVARYVDAILLDSGNPYLPVKELGGTGRTHDWELSRLIRLRAGCPVFLAGGLNADNVRSAIDQVEPFGIDVCSGVRTAGRLDDEKLARFFARVRG